MIDLRRFIIGWYLQLTQIANGHTMVNTKDVEGARYCSQRLSRFCSNIVCTGVWGMEARTPRLLVKRAQVKETSSRVKSKEKMVLAAEKNIITDPGVLDIHRCEDNSRHNIKKPLL